VDRAVLKLEMQRLSLANETDRASKERLERLERELRGFEELQGRGS